MSRCWGAWFASVVVLSTTGGCGAEGSPAAGSASTSAAPASSQRAGAGPSASASSPAFDAKGFCERLCKRSATCGLERAEALAKSGEAADKAALERARADRDGVEKTCLESCSKTPPSSASEEPVVAAEACLAEKECPAFRACLTKGKP